MPENKVKPRRPFEVQVGNIKLDGYMESDRDYVLNNIDLCVELLDKLSRGEST
jgi:hypothetical protein